MGITDVSSFRFQRISIHDDNVYACNMCKLCFFDKAQIYNVIGGQDVNSRYIMNYILVYKIYIFNNTLMTLKYDLKRILKFNK